MNYSVLVVDDDKLVNEFLSETLKRGGYKSESAFSGEEALVLFKQKEFEDLKSIEGSKEATKKLSEKHEGQPLAQ